MAEPTSRIEPASSYREPDSNAASGGNKGRVPQKTKLLVPLPEPAEPDEMDDDDKHALDTLA
ncbi:MAG: hypothetical protein LAN59_13145 [Acidobacteriia bacterium]|nr:hypothetical protein [Terriglobia bacterium]